MSRALNVLVVPAVVLAFALSGTVAQAQPADGLVGAVQAIPAVERVSLHVDFRSGSAALSTKQQSAIRAFAQGVVADFYGATPREVALDLLVVGRATACRARGDLCGDRRLAKARARAIRALLADEGLPARVATRLVVHGGSADSGDVRGHFVRQSGVNWTVVNQSLDAPLDFSMRVEWQDAQDVTRRGVLAPGESLVARNLAVDADGRSIVTVRVDATLTNLNLQILMPGFPNDAAPALCEPPFADGTPFSCSAHGSGRFIVEAIPFPPQ